LRYDPVPFPLTLRTAIADGQGRGDRDPKTMSTGTFDFGWAGRILILGSIHHLGSATLGAAQRRPLLLVGVDGTREDLCMHRLWSLLALPTLSKRSCDVHTLLYQRIPILQYSCCEAPSIFPVMTLTGCRASRSTPPILSLFWSLNLSQFVEGRRW